MPALIASSLLLGCRSRAAEPAPREADPGPGASSAGLTAEAVSALPGVSPAAAPEPRRRPAQPLNVLLLTVDALRADMPWAGYERPIAPHLSALANESAVWESHRSVASYTAQSVATLLSGRYSSSLYRDGYFFTGYSAANLFFPEVLQKQGIRTLALHAHMYFGKDKGLDQGFDIWETVPGISFDAETDTNVTSPKSTSGSIELLGQAENTGRQFFLWTHYMDPHDQYIAHSEAPNFGKRNRDRYDSEVFFADLWLGRLLDFARQQPWWERTAVIITGDHGEAFGEHGMYKHAFALWDVLLRVPLIIHAPGAHPVRIAQGRTHIDLAPTILDLMGLEPLEQFQGRSLVPEIYGAAPQAREPLVLELAEDTHNPGLRAIALGDYKLIVPTGGGKPRLFNLADDPGELIDLAAREPETLRTLLASLQQTFSDVPSIEPFGGMKLRSGRRARGPERPQSE